MKIVRVAIAVPANTLFDYYCNDARSDDIGRCVVVPFGNKTLVGVIVQFAAHSDVPSARLKPVHRVLREAPALKRHDLDLLQFAASYYHGAVGLTILSALPASLRRSAGTRPARAQRYTVTQAGRAAPMDDLPVRAVVQRRLLAMLKERGSVDRAAIAEFAPSAMKSLQHFIAKGWVTGGEVPQAQAPGVRSALRPTPTSEQSAAVDAILPGLGRFSPFLLLGATGSGKTEVYLRVMDEVLRRGRQALLLVPEIALTPQLEQTVGDRFPGDRLVTLHSALNERERLVNWSAAHAGEARIVLGTRLAVFAPLPDLGLIVVDEEHDASFKQSDGLRYSARDVAVVRARQRGVPIVLGSATPALETYYNALSGRYRLLILAERVGAPAPRIGCVSTRGERLVDGLSRQLIAAIAARLGRREQSLVFINRRGFAPVLICRACGWLSGCHRCSANLVLHLAEGRLRCHHCGHEGRVPSACPCCGNPALGPVGQGTQRIEAALRAEFPQARILRIDRDSTRRKLAWPAMRRRIENREIDILVGTQILAKGHDFAHLSLVGVVNADTLLYNTDLRASERLYALLTQVAGRAGRGQTAGEVLIQTEFPEHGLYRALQAQDYATFARALLEERRLAGFPPYVHQALLRAEAPQLATALELLAQAAVIARTLTPQVAVYDPVPAVMMRRAGRERAQLLVQSESRARLQEFLAAWHGRLATQGTSAARWSLDVDPLEF